MVRGKHSVRWVLHWFFYTTHPFSFRLSIYPMLTNVGEFTPHLVNVSFEHSNSGSPSIGITQSISPMTLFHRLLFSSTYHRWSSTFSDVWHCPVLPYQGFRLTLPEDSFILSKFSQIFWFDFFCSSINHLSNYFDRILSSTITDLNYTGQILCLLHVSIISPLSLHSAF